MGNFIFGYDFTDYTITSFSDENADYPSSNLKLYGYLRRQCRSTTTAELTIVLDFTTATAVDAVVLDDVNFDEAYIAGHATNDWGAPSFAEVKLDISQDARVERYKIYKALTAFNYRYMRVRVPNQTATDGLSLFRIGRLVVLDTTLTLGQNPGDYEYQIDAPVKYQDFTAGGQEAVSLGSYAAWEGSFSWNAMDDTHESDMQTISNIARSELIAFYENRSDDEAVYIARRQKAFGLKFLASDVVLAGTITLKEVI